MKVNIFEGGRRVMVILIWMILATGLFVAYSQAPRVDRSFVINGDSPAVQVPDCPASARAEYRYDQLEGRVRTVFCFPTTMTGGIEYLVTDEPALGKPGYLVSDLKYSDGADAYVQRAVSRFSFSKTDEAEALAEYAKQRQSQILGVIGLSLGVAFAFWLMCTLFGWILRGFLGIPSGLDVRPEPVVP